MYGVHAEILPVSGDANFKLNCYRTVYLEIEIVGQTEY